MRDSVNTEQVGRIDHPMESAPKDVREILEHVLQAEKENLHMRKGITGEDVVRIVKGLIR